MCFFVVLRDFKAVCRISEIGAAILAIGVEKEVIQPVVEIIMMGNVALRLARPVDTLQPPDNCAQPAPPCRGILDDAALFPRIVVIDQADQIDDLALFHDQAAVHVSFARA
jgi:hypothetical protein